MAIDDNTVYGLTGAQVKELPGKIEAVKGLAKVLTSDDYNWPTNSPNSVALWLLEPGVYRKGAGITTMSSRIRATGGDGDTFIVSIGTTGFASILQSRTSSTPVLYTTQISNGNEVSVYDLYTFVRDSLTSTSTTEALSANQGKVLNDKIGGDLSNLTTTDKSSLINAINELAGQGGSSYTAGDGIDITDDVISATNTGKARVLTTDDYDYPTDSPARVAVWNLESGIYTAPQANLAVSTSTNLGFGNTIIVYKGSSSITNYVLSSSGSVDIYKTTLAGVPQTNTSVLLKSDVINDLVSTATTRPLSANQGKVLKDLIDAIVIPATFTTNEWNALWA